MAVQDVPAGQSCDVAQSRRHPTTRPSRRTKKNSRGAHSAGWPGGKSASRPAALAQPAASIAGRRRRMPLLQPASVSSPSPAGGCASKEARRAARARSTCGASLPAARSRHWTCAKNVTQLAGSSTLAPGASPTRVRRSGPAVVTVPAVQQDAAPARTTPASGRLHDRRLRILVRCSAPARVTWRCRTAFFALGPIFDKRPAMRPSRPSGAFVALFVAGALAGGCVGGGKGLSSEDKERLKAYVTDVAPADIPHKLDINFENKVHLIGYKFSPEVGKPGSEVKLTYYWRCDEPLEEGWLLFTHTKDDGSGKMGNLDFVGSLRDQRNNGHQVLGPERWEKGKFYTDEQTYKVPDDVTGTDVTVFVGIWKGDARLRIVSGPN